MAALLRVSCLMVVESRSVAKQSLLVEAGDRPLQALVALDRVGLVVTTP